jgi:hypothetical protein
MANTTVFNSKDATDYFTPLAGIQTTPHYVVAAKHTAWDDDLVIPSLSATPQFLSYGFYDEMIFGKKIVSGDTAYMINRNDWTYNTVYDPYNPEDANLESKDFFVVHPELGIYHVFKCLNNAGGIASTFPPKFSETTYNDTQYFTSDGYQWKYMYSIDETSWTKFTTSTHIPVFANSNVVPSSGIISAVEVNSGGATYLSFANGVFDQIAVSGNTRVFAISANNLSTNTNFYTDSTIYIRSGPGAGELKTISGYTISGNSKLVAVNSAFNTIPDLSSTWEITPRVIFEGDGTGATAIAKVNTSTLSVDSITMINEGSGYTNATVRVVGNTGTIVVANSANATALISPKGGHASDILSELFGNKIGISIEFDNSDAFVPDTESYRRLGLLAQPKYSNVIIEFANASGSFIVGEKISQAVKDTFTLTVTNSDEYQYSLTYDIGKYKVLQFSGPVSFANDQVLVQSSNGSVSGVVIDKLATNSILIRTDAGVWVNSTSIEVSGNSSVNGFISSITQGYSNGTIYGRDGSNTMFAYALATDKYNVFVGNTQVSNSNYTINATSIDISAPTLSNSSIVYFDKYFTNSVQESISSNTSLFVTGVMANTSNSTHLVLNEVTGVFTTNTQIEGLSSSVGANIVSITGQEDSFDNRTLITGEYDVGSTAFASPNTVFQYDAANNVIASGIIHTISASGNTQSVYLTNVKGNFEITSNSGSKYIQSTNGAKKIIVNAVEYPHIQRYSGKLLYVENILPVVKDSSQSEKIRLVLQFY